jgi:hypothetical protein
VEKYFVDVPKLFTALNWNAAFMVMLAVTTVIAYELTAPTDVRAPPVVPTFTSET